MFGAGPVLIGVAVLCGWWLDLPALKSIVPGMTTMKANAALGLLAAGGGTLLIPARPRDLGPRIWLAVLGGLVAILLGAVTLAEYVLGLRLGVDEWLFADPHTSSPPYPGRMSPATASGLCCAGAAVLLLCAAVSGLVRDAPWRGRLACAAHLLAIVPVAIGYLAVTGYAYRVDGLYNFGAYVAVAIHTGLGLLMLGPAILLTHARLGWAQALTDHPAARRAFRRLLPICLLFPFLAGLVVVWGARARIYDPLYGPALFALATASASICTAWIGAMVVRGAEDRLREEVAAREAALALLAHAQRMEALGQLASGIAHDFNNVMQAVQGGAALIRSRIADPRAVDDLARTVERSVERGISVTRRLLSFARRDVPQAQHVDCASLLHELSEVLAHSFGTLIDIKVLPPDATLCLVADRGRLETVLVNLAANARDAMPSGGTLTLSGAEEMPASSATAGLPAGRYIRLAVADTGEGMSEAVAARAAEAFFTTKGPGMGTGLGLAMARSFAEQSGGRLAITSAPGQGTVVTLWLPAGGAPAPAPCALAPAGGVSRATVLVVDDEEVVRNVLASGLADLGYTVIEAVDAASALDLLHAGASVGMVLTCYAMRGMNGVALIGAMRAARPGLPAILLTGNATLEAGKTDGICRLHKPVRVEEIAALIEALLAGDKNWAGCGLAGAAHAPPDPAQAPRLPVGNRASRH